MANSSTFSMMLLVLCCLFSGRLFASAANEYKIVGEGQYRVAFWSIYNATLSTPTGKFQGVAQQQPFYLKLQYLRDISKQDLVENTFDQWQKQNIDKAVVAQYKAPLMATFCDVQRSDSFAILVTPNGSQFYFNGAPQGPSFSRKFGVLFAGIWLAENSTATELRQKLIGAHHNE